MLHRCLCGAPRARPASSRGHPYLGGGYCAGDGAGGVGGLPVGGAVRGDHPRGAVRPRGRGGEQRVHGHVPLRRVPARRAVRVAGARQGTGMPLQVLG